MMRRLAGRQLVQSQNLLKRFPDENEEDPPRRMRRGMGCLDKWFRACVSQFPPALQPDAPNLFRKDARRT